MGKTLDVGRERFWEANDAFEYVDRRSFANDGGRCKLDRFGGGSVIIAGGLDTFVEGWSRCGEDGDDMVVAMTLNRLLYSQLFCRTGLYSLQTREEVLFLWPRSFTS